MKLAVTMVKEATAQAPLVLRGRLRRHGPPGGAGHL